MKNIEELKEIDIKNHTSYYFDDVMTEILILEY